MDYDPIGQILAVRRRLRQPMLKVGYTSGVSGADIHTGGTNQNDDVKKHVNMDHNSAATVRLL